MGKFLFYPRNLQKKRSISSIKTFSCISLISCTYISVPNWGNILENVRIHLKSCKFYKKKSSLHLHRHPLCGTRGVRPQWGAYHAPWPDSRLGRGKTPLRTSTLGVYGASITAPLAFNVNELDSGGSRKNIWETGGGAGWPLIIWEE